MELDYLSMAMELGLRGHPSGDHLYCKCPLHNDRTASFSLNIFSGLWFCHAEQRGGRFSQLVMEILDITIGAAERWIVEQSYTIRPFPLERIPAPSPTIDLEAEYATATDHELPDYWFQRGFTWETADAWGIRYNLQSHRLVIPCRFPRGGELVGLITRAVKPGDEPKYRNSPNFPRKTTLFGYDPQLSEQQIILVEGPFDVINAWQHGFPAFATYGAYVTQEQVQLLQRMKSLHRVVIAGDDDVQGRKGADNVMLMTLRRNGIWAVRFRFPAGRKDIGECSAQEIQQGIETATYI